MISSIIVVAICCLLGVWLFTRNRRESIDLEDLVQKIGEIKGRRFMEIIGQLESDEDLWLAMGGLRGALALIREAKWLLNGVRTLAREHPGTITQEYESMWVKCLYLRINVLGCFIENCVRWIEPRLPRIQAHSCARLYSDLWITACAALEECDFRTGNSKIVLPHTQ